MELTNALAVGYLDPALEGQTVTFTCPPGQILNGFNSSTCMGNAGWEPDPIGVECTGGMGTTGATTLGIILYMYVSIKHHDYSVLHKHDIVCFIPAAICDNPLYVLHINDSMKQSTMASTNMCCSGFLIARTNTATCVENGGWKLETSQAQNEGDLLEYRQ
jgi:hypothetical protein